MKLHASIVVSIIYTINHLYFMVVFFSAAPNIELAK